MTLPEKSDSKPVREITTGVGIAILIILVSTLIPAAVLTIPFPVFLYRLKLGRKPGSVIAAVVAGVLMIMSGGVSPDLLFISCLMITGFIMAELFERGFPVDKTVVYSCGSVLAFGGVLSTAVTVISGQSPFKALANQFAQILTRLREVGGGLDLTDEAVEAVAEFMANYLPAGLMVTLFASACVTLMLFRLYVKRKGGMVDVSFRDWKTPDFIIWCLIGTALLQVVPDEGIKIIGINLLVIMMAAYLLQGLMIVSYFFEKFKFPRFLKIALFIGIVIQHVTLIGAVALGLFDTWFNFRKRETKQNK